MVKGRGLRRLFVVCVASADADTSGMGSHRPLLSTVPRWTQQSTRFQISNASIVAGLAAIRRAMKDDDADLSKSEETTMMPLPQPLPPMDDPIKLLERIQAAAAAGSSGGGGRGSVCTTCAFCGLNFPTRSSMFRHLERPSDTCPAPRKDRGEKVFLIVGYDCCLMGARGEAGGARAPAAAIGGEGAATVVLRAMGIEVEKRGGGGGGGDGGGDDGKPPGCSRPGGFSQASSVGSRTCPLLAQEAEVSAT